MIAEPLKPNAEVRVKSFFKWTTITVASAVGATLVYQWVNAARARLERGLERVEQIAKDAQHAVAHTQQALGQTAETARDIRQTIS